MSTACSGIWSEVKERKEGIAKATPTAIRFFFSVSLLTLPLSPSALPLSLSLSLSPSGSHCSARPCVHMALRVLNSSAVHGDDGAAPSAERRRRKLPLAPQPHHRHQPPLAPPGALSASLRVLCDAPAAADRAMATKAEEEAEEAEEAEEEEETLDLWLSPYRFAEYAQRREDAIEQRRVRTRSAPASPPWMSPAVPRPG